MVAVVACILASPERLFLSTIINIGSGLKGGSLITYADHHMLESSPRGGPILYLGTEYTTCLLNFFDVFYQQTAIEFSHNQLILRFGLRVQCDLSATQLFPKASPFLSNAIHFGSYAQFPHLPHFHKTLTFQPRFTRLEGRLL